MIYKLTFQDGRIDWCTAKNQLHLLKSYDAEFDLPLQELEEIQEITDEQAKLIQVSNTEYDHSDPDDSPTLPLFDFADGDEFVIIASTEFY
jgi:hypothetical protein